MGEKLERVSLLIEKYLGDIFGRIRVYRDENKFLIPWGATTIDIILFEEGEEIFLDINSPVALRVNPSKDLMRFLLSENANLKMCAFFVEFEEGYLDIFLGIKIRYSDISRNTLEYILLNVGNLSNEYGKEIISVFGGVSLKEYIERKRNEFPFKSEKILKEEIEINGHKFILEVYSEDDAYLLIGREEGKTEFIIRAKRYYKNAYEVLNLLKEVKKALEERNFITLRKFLNPFEVNFFKLYSLFVKKEDVKKLKQLEEEINKLPDLLITGQISYEDYKKRIKNIEKEIGL